MHYHLPDHIYIAQFQDQLVLLDTKKDKYTVCFKEFSKLLVNILEGEYPRSEFSAQDLDIIQKLVDDKVIEKKETLYPFHIDRKLCSEGVSNVDWRLPLENIKPTFSFPILGALMTIIKVNFNMKVMGFYSTIRMIKKKIKNPSGYIIPEDHELRDLALIVNKACLLHPTRTKCLEWAMTFVLLALKRKWKCNLEIGVQNYPFFAHAWVECGGKIVMDSQDLREGMAIILNEPFRRVKI